MCLKGNGVFQYSALRRTCNYFVLLTSYIPVVVSRRSSSLLVFCCAGSRKGTNRTTAALWKDVVGNFFGGWFLMVENQKAVMCVVVRECENVQEALPIETHRKAIDCRSFDVLVIYTVCHLFSTDFQML